MGSNISEIVPYRTGPWKGLVKKVCMDWFSNPDEWLHDPDKETVLSLDCREVSRHQYRGSVLYSKLMRAQNDGAFKKQELFSRIKWALGPSRAVHIMKVTAAMNSLGHLCPEPLLAVRKTVSDGWHPNLLVTKEVTAPTVEDVIQGRTGLAPLAAVTRAAQELYSLHKDRFIHGDFLPRNTCFDGVNFYFLDNDKTYRWLVTPPFFLARRNLDQFVYNLLLQKGLEECSMELPTAFLEAYASAAGWSAAARNRIFSTVKAKAEARWNRKRELRRKKLENTDG